MAAVTTLFGQAVLVAFAAFMIVAPSTAANETLRADLLARMASEKEARKACKSEICKAFAQPSTGETITCAVTKTWLASDIQAGFLGDRLTWPWGHAQCEAKIELDRRAIEEAATQPKAVVKLRKHDISCKLDGKEPNAGVLYNLKITIEPTVTFVGGKATKVDMGWGSIDAPVVAKAAIWSATEVDASFGVIASGVVKQINDFLFDKCKEVGVDVKPH